MLVGRIENLMPIGVVAVLGCETCAGEAVAWALQQGSSTGDVERALRTIEAMRKLDCFKQRFGADAAVRLEKPLAAARKVLQQAIDRAKK
jgi:4-aminobutyrate aminotransferase-like enzyme